MKINNEIFYNSFKTSYELGYLTNDSISLINDVYLNMFPKFNYKDELISDLCLRNGYNKMLKSWKVGFENEKNTLIQFFSGQFTIGATIEYIKLQK